MGQRRCCMAWVATGCAASWRNTERAKTPRAFEARGAARVRSILVFFTVWFCRRVDFAFDENQGHVRLAFGAGALDLRQLNLDNLVRLEVAHFRGIPGKLAFQLLDFFGRALLRF